MATRNEIIYSIRNLAYGGITSSEATISTAQIAFWIDVERAKLMKEEFEKNKALSPIWIQDLGCVEVTCADKVECCDFGCGSDEYIYKTVLPIPRPVNINWSGIHNNTLITYVGLATHDHPFEFTAEPIAQWARFKRWTPKKPRAFLRGQHIYITNIRNPSHLEVINIKGVFENPDKVVEFVTCGENCITGENEYPIPTHLLSPLQQLVYDKWLRPAMGTNTDYENNSNPVKPVEPA